jgi:hypothetical protein
MRIETPMAAHIARLHGPIFWIPPANGGAGRYQKRVESPVTVIRGCSNIAQEIAAIRVKTVRLINAQIVRPASRRRLLS